MIADELNRIIEILHHKPLTPSSRLRFFSDLRDIAERVKKLEEEIHHLKWNNQPPKK